MLSVGNAVYLLLKSNSTLAALVTNNGVVGIWPGSMPQNGSYPAIVRWITNRTEIPVLGPVPGVSALVRYEFRLICASKSTSIEKSQSTAFNVFTAMDNALRAFGKGYIYDLSSPVDKLWIEGISESRNMQEAFNQETFTWETGATYDISVKPTN